MVRLLALAIGLALSGFSVVILGLATNWFAAGLLAFTIFFYAVVYSMWLKRSTPQNIVIGGAAGAILGAGIGLSTGGIALLAILGASGSYIAVPAAMRVAMPEANPSIYLTLSLGVTFPFNLTIGLPIYLWMAQTVSGG